MCRVAHLHRMSDNTKYIPLMFLSWTTFLYINFIYMCVCVMYVSLYLTV